MTAPDSGREKAEALRAAIRRYDRAEEACCADLPETPRAAGIYRQHENERRLATVSLADAARLLARSASAGSGALRAENDKLREALKFYADAAEWELVNDEFYPGLVALQEDAGQQARAALAQAGAVDSKEG